MTKYYFVSIDEATWFGIFQLFVDNCYGLSTDSMLQKQVQRYVQIWPVSRSHDRRGLLPFPIADQIAVHKFVIRRMEIQQEASTTITH